MSRRPAFIRPGIRQAEIHDIVARRGEVSVDDLAAKFDASPETIRRDLTVLAGAGHVRKIHGGARSLTVQGEGEFDVRMRRNTLAKHQIAEKLLDLVKPHMTLFIDTGSTTLICAQSLARIKGLTVITNSTSIAAAFDQGRGGAEIYLLGGRYSGGNAQTVGSAVISQIATYRADMAIITVGAISAGGGMDFSNHEAQVARAMMVASNQVTVVADHKKFNRCAPFIVSDLNGIDQVVFDKTPDDTLMTALQAAEIEVH